MLSMPTSLRAKKLGFTMLADLQMLGLEYQHTSMATSRALLKSKPELARDFMRAYVEGIHFAKTNRKETMDILGKYLRTDDREVLEETYESIVQTLVPEKPYPTLKGIQIILREFGLKDAAARSARPEQFVDTTILKELDSSGFIDKLYKSQAVAKVTPRPEPAATKAPLVEAKTKAVATEEKAKPVSKSVPATPEPAAAAKTAAKGAQQYTVKAGDTLGKIAEQFYNTGTKWEKIYEANKDVLKNPHYIFIGMKLTIPADA
jgi:LysM repeat protein